ncbi:MAG TPA: hypothetical protein VKB52_00370 [Rhodanobacteraceae bacterium]|nr:hypothetical protein [Rhodanobacteraceae bacterium]
MQTPGIQALLCWITALTLIVAALFVFLGVPETPDGAGEAIGRVIAQTGIASLATWLIARKKDPAWSWGRFAAVYVAMLVVIGIVASIGHKPGTDGTTATDVTTVIATC